ncbi:MAG: WD40 repeat domain-containing protein [Spirochaetaceae bacterium]|jgi:hypothetical protein|nr:WD40 repeat domain-containing protein [Spirochaetaceae bacterium]
MFKVKPHYRYILYGTAFVFYAFLAARPAPPETVFTLMWLDSLASSYPSEDAAAEELVPFNFGGTYGYVSTEGRFTINQPKTGYVEQSESLFAEFSGQDEKIEVRDTQGRRVFTLNDKRGYPFFRDSRIFIVSSEQNSISEVGTDDDVLWTFDFSSPISCVDAAAGLLLVGCLDGAIELIDGAGKRLYATEPSGSRIPAIYGCALSRDGTKIAAVSGLDHQRFLVIEYDGGVWRITHHEFLGDGFRRPVHVRFVDGGLRVAYERAEGLGIYNLIARSSETVPFDGRILHIEDGDDDGMLFLVVSESDKEKRFAAVRYPDHKILSAPFKSADTFLKKRRQVLIIGGGSKLAAFKIEKM